MRRKEAITWSASPRQGINFDRQQRAESDLVDRRGGERTVAGRHIKDSDIQKRAEVIRSTEPHLSPAPASNRAEGLSVMAIL